MNVSSSSLQWATYKHQNTKVLTESSVLKSLQHLLLLLTKLLFCLLSLHNPGLILCQTTRRWDSWKCNSLSQVSLFVDGVLWFPLDDLQLFGLWCVKCCMAWQMDGNKRRPSWWSVNLWGLSERGTSKKKMLLSPHPFEVKWGKQTCSKLWGTLMFALAIVRVQCYPGGHTWGGSTVKRCLLPFGAHGNQLDCWDECERSESGNPLLTI